MDDNDTKMTVERIADRLQERGLWLAAAESCTGGLAGHTLTGVSGSSGWFRGAVVAYQNDLKESLLGVPAQTLQAHGAVSRETVRAMAEGAARLLGAQVTLAVSGIAGPTGGTPDKPVGTVWIAWLGPAGAREERFCFEGGRDEVKARSVRRALAGVLDVLGGEAAS
jgi:nicotinamide-nucleotide amidase